MNHYESLRAMQGAVVAHMLEHFAIVDYRIGGWAEEEIELEIGEADVVIGFDFEKNGAWFRASSHVDDYYDSVEHGQGVGQFTLLDNVVWALSDFECTFDHEGYGTRRLYGFGMGLDYEEARRMCEALRCYSREDLKYGTLFHIDRFEVRVPHKFYREAGMKIEVQGPSTSFGSHEDMRTYASRIRDVADKVQLLERLGSEG